MYRERNEYQPLIKKMNNKYIFYVQFFDATNSKQQIEISKEVFMQFFGVHKVINDNDNKRYLITYRNDNCYIELEVDKEEYDIFDSFESQAIREHNEYNRYIEHSELTDASLYHRTDDKQLDVIDMLFNKDLNSTLISAIAELDDKKKMRIIKHYFYGVPYQKIANEEGCSKVAVKYSIDIGISKLKEKLNKFIK